MKLKYRNCFYFTLKITLKKNPLIRCFGSGGEFSGGLDTEVVAPVRTVCGAFCSLFKSRSVTHKREDERDLRASALPLLQGSNQRTPVYASGFKLSIVCVFCQCLRLCLVGDLLKRSVCVWGGCCICESHISFQNAFFYSNSSLSTQQMFHSCVPVRAQQLTQ